MCDPILDMNSLSESDIPDLEDWVQGISPIDIINMSKTK
jgi:hypothetical protein